MSNPNPPASAEAQKLFDLIRDHCYVGREEYDDQDSVVSDNPEALLDALRDFFTGDEKQVQDGAMVVRDLVNAERLLQYAEHGMEAISKTKMETVEIEDLNWMRQFIPVLYKQIPWVEEETATKKD